MKKTGSKFIVIVLVIIAAAVGFMFFRKTSKIHAMEKKLEESQERFDQYYLYDHEDEYQNLVDQCKYAINQKNYESAQKAQKELDQFEDEIVEENTEKAESYFSELKKVILPKLMTVNLRKLTNLKKN